MIDLSASMTGIDRVIKINENSKITLEDRYTSKFVIDASTNFFENNLFEIIQSLNIELPDLFPEPLKKSYVEIHGDNVDWARALGKEKFVLNTSSYLKKVKNLVSSSDPHDYLSTLIKGRKIFSLLERAKVDSEKLSIEISKRDSAILKSLMPVKDDRCELVRYSHKSQTGRMSVVAGPKVLLLQKEDRKFFKPSNPSNILAQIDFVSLEPRVVYLMTHKDSPRDIYEEMGKFIGDDTPRSKLKIATISSLYGSTKVEKRISEKVMNFFNLEKIKSDFLSGEKIYNFFGRPLNPDSEHVKLSHFIQSTAVDIVLLGMSKFAQENNIIPYFLIHDSLVFECKQSVYEEMLKKDLFIEVEPIGKFYLELSKFGE